MIKDILTTTPIIKIPDMEIYFLVCTDASKEGLGGDSESFHRVTYKELH
jgi:hypothetical protein